MGASLALAGLTACTKQPDGEDPALRAAARGAGPGPAALLRDRLRPRRLRARRSSSRATRAGRPRSRATPTTRRASARPTSSARPTCSASTTPTARRPSSTSARTGPGATFRAALREALAKQKAKAGRGPPLPDAAARPRPRSPRRWQAVLAALPAGEVGELGAGRPRQRARGRRAGLRRAGRGAVPPRPGRRDPEPRGRLRRRAHPASLRLVREFARAAQGRAPETPEMNRLYVVEGSPTPTGAVGRPPPRAAPAPRSRASRARWPPAVGVAVEGARRRTPWVAPLVKDLQARAARRRS